MRQARATPADDCLRGEMVRATDAAIGWSVSGLYARAPHFSARQLVGVRGKRLGAMLVLIAAISFALAPETTLVAFAWAAAAFFSATLLFRVALTAIGLSRGATPKPAPPLEDKALPVITVLLPVFDEDEGLPILAAAMDAIDYPAEKLDIKLLLEESDARTIREARRLGLDDKFECLVIPTCEPRTKPKACNAGLFGAAGDLIVIYDAEDAPEPDQLRKAAAAFAAGDDRLACVQARLNFYNAEENLLTRLFALEYALWFDVFLPALERLGAPIPLGGTSNFFRTRTLRDLGGWDPHNVTEDADLGLRLSRLGFRTAILDSTTFEEANCDILNWIRQRSRWMKGYMQTWLVHARDVRSYWRATGIAGLAGLHLFVAGNFVSALLSPLLWTGSLVFLALSEVGGIEAPKRLVWLNLFLLIAGNAIFVALGAVAPLKRGWRRIAPFALLAPLYWQLAGIAAYKALWQLFTRPSYWEKTDHVLSAAAKTEAQTGAQ